jgi:hypothetical protein
LASKTQSWSDGPDDLASVSSRRPRPPALEPRRDVEVVDPAAGEGDEAGHGAVDLGDVHLVVGEDNGAEEAAVFVLAVQVDQELEVRPAGVPEHAGERSNEFAIGRV